MSKFAIGTQRIDLFFSCIFLYSFFFLNKTRDSDRELLYLKEYLLLIAANEPDFTVLDHRKWERYVNKFAHKKAKLATTAEEQVEEQDGEQSNQAEE